MKKMLLFFGAPGIAYLCRLSGLFSSIVKRKQVFRLGICLLIACLTGLIYPAMLMAQQQKVIVGKVSDENGKPIEGVSVLVTNNNTGTATDANGKFTLKVPANAVLSFSAINYSSTRVAVGNQSAINVQLKSKDADLSDVVVVGYATQKKVDLTGSVSAISVKQMSDRPTTNISSSLAGLASGVYIRQTSGMPGSDAASINIRGIASLSSSSVLVVVDGVTSSLDAVNPNDVESISILKDAASASIYGALAGNGVILITTKKGARSKPTLTYTSIYSQTNPTGLPKFVTNSARYMQLINEASRNIGNTDIFDSATTIQPFIYAQSHPNDTTSFGVPNYIAYPNTNWENVLFQHKLLQNHNISVSGGNENTTYLLSLGYLNNPGLVANSGVNKYSFRANVESKIGDKLTVGTQTFAYYQDYGMFDNANLFNYLVQTSPMIYPYYNGKYGSTSAVGDVIGQASDLLYYTTSRSGSQPTTYLNSTWYGRAQLLKGLTFEPKVNYTVRFDEANYSDNPIATERWNFLTMQMVTAPTVPSLLSTTNYWWKGYSYTLESLLRYNTTVAKQHSIGALLGFNQYYYNEYSTTATGLGLIDPTVPALSTATSNPSKPTSSYTNWAMRSLFGRINYNYAGKYLVEANLRSDQSSRFGPNFRRGIFPSASIGWMLGKERFMQGLEKANIKNVKLRASYGQLGNAAGLGNYQWQALYGPVNYSYSGSAATGLATGSIANSNLHWETMNVTDIGLDATLFNQFNFSVDWYRRYTKGSLIQTTMDLTVGTASAPYDNLGDLLSNGIELNIGWKKQIGQVGLIMNGNFGYNYLSKVLAYKGPLVQTWTTDANGNKIYSDNIASVSAGGNNRIVEGHQVNEFYLQPVYRGTGTYTKNGTVDPDGGPKDGMIRTPDDLNWVNAMKTAGYKFAPLNTVGKGQLYYGDLIYANNNGDSIYGGSADKKFFHKSTLPKFVYGFNLAATYKNFDLSMVWAGAAGMSYYWNQTYYNSSTVAIGGTIPEKIANDHYYYNDNNASDPKNNINGFFPRIKKSDNVNNVASDFWLYNASYLRLKNLQIGYNFYKKNLGIAGNYISKMRFFVSGENIVTITKFPGPDPELGTTVGYPTMKQYAFGVNVTF
jgi:TonB-linked SusC/RagA family outer membrane protein